MSKRSTIQKLADNDFLLWRFEMNVLLWTKKLLKLVTGVETRRSKLWMEICGLVSPCVLKANCDKYGKIWEIRCITIHNRIWMKIFMCQVYNKMLHLADGHSLVDYMGSIEMIAKQLADLVHKMGHVFIISKIYSWKCIKSASTVKCTRKVLCYILKL